MPNKETTYWYVQDGLAHRRGATDLTPALTTIHSHNINAIPLSSPISLANYRLVMGDSNFNTSEISTAGQTLEVVAETGHGNVLKQNYPASVAGKGQTASIDGPFMGVGGGVDEAWLSYDVNFYSAGTFDFGRGFKLPGLGGARPGFGNPPSAGAPTVNGFSSRLMMLHDNAGGQITTGNLMELIGYTYDPTQAGGFGVNRHTLVNLVQNTWYNVKQHIIMNSINVEGSSGNADGTHEIYLDDVLVYEKVDGSSNPNMVWRFYAAANITHLVWSTFYGGDNTWAPATPQTILFDNIVIEAAI